ncbi:hypothetical protein L6164_020669 [Bauhinia variegata]|uniref:Uncharacterized protein n=1 Tax=Bauhinia variegata TaxID=167791 RepID=A0ACB9MZ93_BAUVA|nr:hypothetical protein L6164_020669 [Bauhinia variegata]
MAVAASLSFTLDPQNLHHQCRFNASNLCRPHQSRRFTLSTPHCKHPLSLFHKEGNFSFKSSSSSSSHSSSSTTTTSSNLEDPFRTGRFLSNEELEKLKFLENFRYFQELKSGSMFVRVMRPEEMDITVDLLAVSFAESMQLPSGYISVLKFFVKQYLIERRTSMPHMATLIGFYRGMAEGGEEQEVQLAGTVEVCFNKRGASASPPTPTPPKDSPYICNMAVKRSLRRRGIGWHLLKAGEELISQMSSSRETRLQIARNSQITMNGCNFGHVGLIVEL